MKLRLAVMAFAALWGAHGQTPKPDPASAAGNAAYARGDYDAALAGFERAWDGLAATPGEDPRRLQVLQRLTAVLMSAGRWDEAEQRAQQAIDWLDRYDRDNREAAASELTGLAMILRGKREYGRALAVMERVLWIHSHKEGSREGGNAVVEDHVRIGQLYMECEQEERAVGAFESALELASKMNGAEHASLAPLLDRLAEAHLHLRDYPSSETVLRRALVIRERVHGPQSADLIGNVDGLAYALFGQQKYGESEAAYRRLIGLWERSAGAEHPMLAITYDKLALLYREQERVEDADAATGRAIAIRGHFLAAGLVADAHQALSREERPRAVELLRRALAAAEAGGLGLAMLHQQIEGELRMLEEAAPRPTQRKSAPGAGPKQLKKRKRA